MGSPTDPVIEVATLAGGETNQDRYLVGPDFAAVMDGASSFGVDAGETGGEYAQRLSAALEAQIVGGWRPLADVVHDAIAQVSEAAPTTASSTLALVRWDHDTVEIYCLGDSVAAVIDVDGREQVFSDDRISKVAPWIRSAYRERLKNGGGFTGEHQQRLQALQRYQLQSRNRPGGYWIASDLSEAANHALESVWPVRGTRQIILATDGAAAAISRYHLASSWAQVIREGDAILQRAHELENSDLTGKEWPRSKVHDDKTVVSILFNGTE